MDMIETKTYKNKFDPHIKIKRDDLFLPFEDAAIIISFAVISPIAADTTESGSTSSFSTAFLFFGVFSFE